MALSKCIKLLQHFTEDASQNPVALPAPYVINFTSPTKLQNAFNAALQATRTPAIFPDFTTLGITKLADADTGKLKMGISLVDLTGPTRLATPESVGLNEDKIFTSGSIFKLAPMFAAHQLKFDMMAKFASAPATLPDAKAKLKWAFDEIIKDWKAKGLDPSDAPNLLKILTLNTSNAVDFDPTFDKKMRLITASTSSINDMNEGAAHLINRLHWRFIASALLQTGITDTTNGGLWVCGLGKDESNYWHCAADGGDLVTPTTKSKSVQQVTPKSAARYLTLIAQERLISAQIARDLKAILDNGDLGWLTGGLAEMDKVPSGGGLSNLAKFNKDLSDHRASVRVFGKHGAYGPWAGEALGIERDSAQGRLRYVVIVVTDQRKSGIDYDDMLNFVTRAAIPILDGVIVTNNTP